MTDKELEMLEEEAKAQIPSTNAKKILVLISTIREQRGWLKEVNETFDKLKLDLENHCSAFFNPDRWESCGDSGCQCIKLGPSLMVLQKVIGSE